MEGYEKDHITKNLDKLVELTCLNTSLLVKLSAAGIFSKADVDKISSDSDVQHRIYVLYEIAMTRKDGYNVLTRALLEVQQTGAAEILTSLSDEKPNLATVPPSPRPFTRQTTIDEPQRSFTVVVKCIQVTTKEAKSGLKKNPCLQIRFEKRKMTTHDFYYGNFQNKTSVIIVEGNFDDNHDVNGIFRGDETYYFTDTLSWENLFEDQKKEFLQTKQIYINGQQHSLGDICEIYDKLTGHPEGTVSLMKQISCAEMLEFLDITQQIEIGQHLPVTSAYYVERKLEPRTMLDPKIFGVKEDPENIDIFCFSGLEWYQLSSVVEQFGNKKLPINRSGLQLQSEEFDAYIVMDTENTENDFHELAKKLAKIQNLHLIRCIVHEDTSEIQEFHWVHTYGSLKTIQKFINPDQRYREENEYLEELILQQHPKLILGPQGIGKAKLAKRIIQKINAKKEFAIAETVPFKEFIRNLRETKAPANVNDDISLKDVFEITANMLSKSGVGRTITKAFLQAAPTIFHLLLTDMDEIHPDKIDDANKVLQLLKDTRTCQLWVTSTPHLLHELENTLDVLGFHVCPLNNDDQEELIIQCLTTHDNPHENITKFLKAELQHFREKMSDILSFPTGCILFAETLKPSLSQTNNHTSEIAHVNYTNPISDMTITGLLTSIVKKKFNLEEISKIGGSQEDIKQILYAHMLLALKEILPSGLFDLVQATLIKTFGEIEENIPRLLRYGILVRTPWQSNTHFAQKCFLEYFAALAVIEVVRILDSSQEVDNDSSISRNNLIKAFYSICKYIMVTKIVEKSVTLHSDPVVTWEFVHKEICCFLNSLLPYTRRSLTDPMSLYLKTDKHRAKVGHHLWRTLNASITENFDKLAVPIIECIQNIFKKNDFPPETYTLENIVFLAARYCKNGNKIMKIVSEFYQSWSSKKLPSLEFPVLKSNSGFLERSITVLHIAVEAGDFQVVQYLLLNHFTDISSDDKFQNLLYSCVSSSHQDDKVVLPDKKQILSYLVIKNKNLVNKIDSLILQRMRVKLLFALLKIRKEHRSIELPIENVQNDQGKTILHLLAENHYNLKTSKIYHELLSELKNYVHFDLDHKDSQGCTPVHYAVECLDLSEESLHYFMDHEVDFNWMDNRGSPMIFKAISGHRKLKFLEKFVDLGASLHLVNSTNVSSLHVAAGCWNFDGVVLILQRRVVDVNAQDSSGNTPLHYVFSKDFQEWEKDRAEPNNQHRIISLLIKKGARIDIKNNESLTPLGIALDDLCSSGDETVLEFLKENRTRMLESGMVTYVLKGILLNAKFGREWHPDIVKLLCPQLMKLGGNINAKDENGASLLHLTAKHHAVAGVEFLTGNPELNLILDDEGRSPKYYMCCQQDNPTPQDENIQCYKCSEILRLLHSRSKSHSLSVSS